MYLKKATIATEEAIKDNFKMYGQYDACGNDGNYHDPAEDEQTHGLCGAGDCACEAGGGSK